MNYTDKGLEAVVFTADGDMRHALNNLQWDASFSKCFVDQAKYVMFARLHDSVFKAKRPTNAHDFFNERLFAEFMDSFFGDQARFPEHHVIFYRGAAAGSNVALDK